jgi:hypothetical protein
MNARAIGFAVTAIAGLTVLYNVVQTAYNQQQIEENALGTFLSGGANLKHSYSFTPPFTGFEVVVLVALALGVLMVIFGGGSKKPN